MNAAYFNIFRCFLAFAILVTKEGAASTCPGSCPIVAGPAGRDGRDGLPGQAGKDGKDGASMSVREFIELREQISRTFNFEEIFRNLSHNIQNELYHALKREVLREVHNEFRQCCSQPTTPPPPTPGPMVYSSCQEVFDLTNGTAASDNYYIRSDGGSAAVEVYCNMVPQGSNRGGWMRVAYICPSSGYSFAACPQGVAVYDVGQQKLCGPAQDSSCSSATVRTHGVAYRKIQGQATGRAYGFPCAFNYDRPQSDGYFSGLTISQGLLSQDDSHIWTFAAGFSEVQSHGCNCPCSIDGSHPPSYVGSHFYCDTPTFANGHNWDTANILWDGYNCYRGNSTDCCANQHQPWFQRELDTTTTNDITLRWCTPHSLSYSNFGTDLVELYIN